MLVLLTGFTALAQAVLPQTALPDQPRTGAPTEPEQPEAAVPTPQAPGRAPEPSKSPFGLDPDAFPGVIGSPTAPVKPEGPASPTEPSISTVPSTTTVDAPVSPFESPPGAPSAMLPTPPLAAPPFLTPQYSFGASTPFVPASPALPAVPPSPPTSVGLQPLRPGALPVQASDHRAPPILVLPTVSLFQGYTDNPRSTPSTLSDSITRLGGATTVSIDSARLQGQLSAALNYRKYARATDQDSLNANALAYGLGTVVRDHVFVDGRASVNQLSRTGNLGFADPALIPPSQQTQATIVSLTPIVRQSLDRYVDGELRYNFGMNMFRNGSLLGDSGTAASSPSLSDSTRHRGTLSIATSRYFTFLGSKLTLDALQVDSQSAAKSTQLKAFDDLEYQFDRQFAALGRFGYENIEYPLQPSATTNGPIWVIGGRYTPFPGSYLVASFGRQEGIYGFAGALRYEVTPAITILGSLERNRASPQEDMLNNLNYSQVDSFGNVVNQTTGLPSGLANPEFSLANAVFRSERARAGVRAQFDRDVVSLFAFIEHRVPLGTPLPAAGASPTLVSSDTSRGVNLSWGRSLSPRLTATAALGYASQVTGDQRTLTANLAMTYTISEHLNAVLQYQFIDVDGAIAGSSYWRNQVEIGLARSF